MTETGEDREDVTCVVRDSVPEGGRQEELTEACSPLSKSLRARSWPVTKYAYQSCLLAPASLRINLPRGASPDRQSGGKRLSTRCRGKRIPRGRSFSSRGASTSNRQAQHAIDEGADGNALLSILSKSQATVRQEVVVVRAGMGEWILLSARIMPWPISSSADWATPRQVQLPNPRLPCDMGAQPLTWLGSPGAACLRISPLPSTHACVRLR